MPPFIAALCSLILVRPMKLLVPFTALVVATTAVAETEVGGMTAGGKADGKQFTFSITAAAVKNAPAWSLDSLNPPLSPREAQSIAEVQLEKFVRDPKQWHVREVCLMHFGDHVHWAYTVRFEREYPPDLAVYGADYFEIPVLMSGGVFTPKVVSLPLDEIKPAK
jgi:hypothetical protein